MRTFIITDGQFIGLKSKLEAEKGREVTDEEVDMHIDTLIDEYICA